MKKCRNWMSLLLTALLLLSLTACGDKGGRDPEVTTLTMASFAMLDRTKKQLQNAVEQFNRDHPDIQIELQDYYGEDYQTAKQNRDRLLTEITAGRGPDIIDLGRGGLPLQQLARRGYLEDLWPYIENDPELGGESLLEAPLQAVGVKGGLYTAFDSVHIYTLAGSKDVVGDRTSWTLEDVRETFASMPEDATVMEFFMTRSDLLYYMLPMCLEDYVDWETGQCGFDCAGFRAVMEFINSFPEPSGMDWSSAEAVGRLNEETVLRQQKGMQMLTQAILSGPDDIQQFDLSWDGASFPGYPVGDGSLGSAFALPETTLLMSSSCKNKEAAWEFIRQRFLPKYSSVEAAAEDFRDSSIPVNLSDYNMKKQASMLDGTFENRYMSNGDTMVEMHPVTEEEMRRFEGLLISISRTTMYDRDLLDIVQEASGPYFSGDRSLDETVEQIQNRVTLYVNESR